MIVKSSKNVWGAKTDLSVKGMGGLSYLTKGSEIARLHITMISKLI